MRQSRASNLDRVQRINNSGRNVKQRRLRMIFAEVVVVAPLATLPHDPLACLGSFLLCLLAAWISNTIVWALFPPYLPPSLPCCLSTRPFFIVKKLLTLMLSTCKKKVNNICSLAIEVTFHTLAKPHHLLNLLLSQSTPVSPSPLVKRSIASRHLSATGDFWWLLADFSVAHVAIICSKLKFISGQTLPQTTLTEKRRY